MRMNRKGFAPLFLVILAACAMALGGVGYMMARPSYMFQPGWRMMLGGDRDQYGCIGAAGYSWCAAKSKCLRAWEEKCEKSPDAFIINNFNDCARAVNPVMESYPRQCRANGQTFVEEINNETLCRPEQRNAEVWTQEYAPVCAKVNIQCIKAPCNPILETYSNACSACANSLVESYMAGECGGQIRLT